MHKISTNQVMYTIDLLEVNKLKINVFESKDKLYRSVSEFYIKAINDKPNIILGLATGTTPIPLYKNLIKAYQDKLVSFKDVVTFNLDEYRSEEHTSELQSRPHLVCRLLLEKKKKKKKKKK